MTDQRIEWVKGAKEFNEILDMAHAEEPTHLIEARISSLPPAFVAEMLMGTLVTLAEIHRVVGKMYVVLAEARLVPGIDDLQAALGAEDGD